MINLFCYSTKAKSLSEQFHHHPHATPHTILYTQDFECEFIPDTGTSSGDVDFTTKLYSRFNIEIVQGTLLSCSKRAGGAWLVGPYIFFSGSGLKQNNLIIHVNYGFPQNNAIYFLHNNINYLCACEHQWSSPYF